jgi:hypothetical protein
MRSVYRVLAWLVAIEVAVQAAVIAFAFFGLMNWVDSAGGVLDAASHQSRSAHFTGSIGFMLHAINGQMIVPLLAVLLLIASFFAKTQGAVLWGMLALVAVVVQVVLGSLAHGAPVLGLLHGVVALAVFAFALTAAQRPASPPAAAPAAPAPTTAGVA